VRRPTWKLAAAFERYGNARNQVLQFRQQILPDARESLDLVAGTYKQGESSFLVLLTAQRTYFHTMLAYLDAQRELWETAIAIDGLMLTDSLQAGEIPNAAIPAASVPGRMPFDPFMGR
jgi:outer membrane protein, heavy metal efflux system